MEHILYVLYGSVQLYGKLWKLAIIITRKLVQAVICNLANDTASNSDYGVTFYGNRSSLSDC